MKAIILILWLNINPSSPEVKKRDTIENFLLGYNLIITKVVPFVVILMCSNIYLYTILLEQQILCFVSNHSAKLMFNQCGHCWRILVWASYLNLFKKRSEFFRSRHRRQFLKQTWTFWTVPVNCIHNHTVGHVFLPYKMGYAATKPDKVNIGITKYFRGQNYLVIIITIVM